MRKLFWIVFLHLIAFAVSAQSPDPYFNDKTALLDKQNFIRKSAFVENQSYLNNDVVYQRMEWEIDPNIKYIKGNVTSYFVSKTSGLDEIEFDLHKKMTVDSIVQNRQNISFTRNNNRIVIPLKNKLDLDKLDSLTIYYQGIPDDSGFGAFSQGEHAGVPVVWTLSEPYGAMEWWPCKQSLVDKIDSIDVIVTSPEPFRTASNGKLISEKVKNGKTKTHWKHRHPIATYLIAIAVTNYENYSEYVHLKDGRQIEILNYIYPENIATAKTKTPVTAEIMELFNELIGEYPFADEKYGHAQFGWGGGMEHQTMSFMGGFGFDLIAHELAHQWFGDYITVGTWQDIWLNEGFATYFTGLAYENLLDGYWWPKWKQQTVTRIVSQPDGSVFVTDTTSISQIFSGRLSYSKGAYILHMLRWILGEDAFLKGIKSYYNDPEIANGFAKTNQFIKHMELAGDTSLSEFFNDWYYGEGFPVYSVEYAQDESAALKIKLSQNASHSAKIFFEMPVPVRVYNSGKTDSMDFRINNTANGQEFIFDPGFPVSEIKIDPDYWLVSKTADITKVQWQSHSDKVFVYPNPIANTFSIALPNGIIVQKIQIFSIDGKLVRLLNANKTTFNLDLPKATYFIEIETQNETFLQKIIKL